MNEIVTIEEFCRQYNIHEVVRKMKGWDFEGVKRTTEEKFENMQESQEECGVKVGEKRPGSRVIMGTCCFPALKKHFRPISSGQAVGTASSLIMSDGLILESEELFFPISRGSIMQSDSYQASLWDDDAHMTTQSSPPPILLSSTIEK